MVVAGGAIVAPPEAGVLLTSACWDGWVCTGGGVVGRAPRPPPAGVDLPVLAGGELDELDSLKWIAF